MDCGIPGSSLLRYLKELAQTQACQIADAIQPSHPLLPPSPPILSLSQHQGLFQWVGSLYQVTRGIGASALPSVLPMNVQAWFPLRLTVLSSCCSRGSPEPQSSPAPQSENISSLVLSLLYGPTDTSVHDYLKNHSCDYTDLGWQRDVSAFSYTV